MKQVLANFNSVFGLLSSVLMISSVCFAGRAFADPNLADTFYDNASGSPLVSLLVKAKKSIDIEIYEMDDPLVLTSIKAAVERGVRVRIIKEEFPVGASCRVFIPKLPTDLPSCQNQKDLVQMVQKSGGQYVPFKNSTLCGMAGTTCFEHGKIIIVDAAQALISTGNFNTSSLCNKKELPVACNRDYSVVSVDQNVVHTLTQIFEKDLIGASYKVNELLLQAPTQKLTVSPFSMAPLKAFIASAVRKIQIQNQYLKEPELNQAILDAAKRGVKIEIMVASACSFAKPTVNDISKWTSTYSAFDQAGIATRIFTRNIKISGFPGYLHAKAIVVDDSRAWVGSVNGSLTSLSDNREYGIFLSNLSEVKKLQVFLDQDFKNPNGESWQDSLTCKHDPAPTVPNAQ